MSVLEELKSSTRDSLESKQRELSELANESKDDAFDEEVFRDAMLDVLSQVRIMYQVTIAQARDTQDIDQVAELWKETHLFYKGALSMWQGMNAICGDSPKDELFVYCGELIKRLAQASADQYRFHAE